LKGQGAGEAINLRKAGVVMPAHRPEVVEGLTVTLRLSDGLAVAMGQGSVRSTPDSFPQPV
jgi:hypothetical protein